MSINNKSIKETPKNKKFSFFVWVVSGILMMAVLTAAVTFIDDEGITTPFINSTGNLTINERLSIGTSNPTHDFHVVGDVNLNNTLFINKSGNVGIGTSSPDRPLHIIGSNAILELDANSGTNSELYLSVNGTDKFRLGTVGASQNEFRIRNEVNATTLFYIDSNDNVGIGTASPSEKLDVQGNVSIGSGFGIGFANDINSLRIDHAGIANTLAFYTSGSERLRIDNIGNVGIGTSNPIIQLQVEDAAGDNTAVVNIVDTSANTNDRILNIQAADATPSSNDYFIMFLDSGSTADGQIRGTGAGGIAYDTSSDRRLKYNIRDTLLGLDEIMSIKVRDYERGEFMTTQTGFIAQELHKVHPGIVHKGGDEETDPEIKDVWGLDYGKLTPLLTRAIQEQQSQIESLQSQNDLLKSELCSKDPTYSWC